jgi:hypothetical protein
VVRLFLFALADLFMAIPAQPASSCDSAIHSEIVSPRASRLAPAKFEAVHLEMTMWEIVELLGPAQRELGSGMMILAWESTDGRVFLVGGTSMCKPPLYARFDLGVPSNKSLERTREG